MEKWIKKIMQFGGLFLFMSCNQPVDVVTIDLSREEAEIPPSLYGIFFEEITHSGDGGLYAEMIRNRGFEDGTLPSGTVLKDGKAVAKPLHCYSNDSINHFSIAWNDSLFMESWEVKCVSDTRPPFYEITEVKPLNNATPHALFIDLGASASDVWVVNDGYWGIAVTEGQRYNFQFYLFTEELKNTVVTAALLDCEEQIVVSKNFQIERDGSWNHYEGAFTVDTTANDLRFALLLPHKGKVYIDFVSMFPENTFCGHKNGLREDVAGMLRDLRPDFVRWPGGCIVEGLTMDNRIKWKETIGDIVKRPGEYNLWGYRSTYGFGYHEFLQFCEDIDADGLFVCNAGMSCLFRNGDYWEEENRIAIIEIGGTVGDIESQPFLEAIRQFQHEAGHENAVLIHVTLIPYLGASGELKSKPTQQSVKELQSMGLWPDVLVCRSEHPLPEELKKKIALFCNVPVNHVLQNLDVEYLYEAPLAMEKEHLAQVVCESLQLPCPEPDLTDWKQMVEDLRNPIHEVEIAMVGKYIQLHDAYLSVVEALKHGGIAARANVKIRWVDSEEITPENVAEKLKGVDGILVPGGFGTRGTEGKIEAIRYAREEKIPFLGICLGMQMAIVEFARDVIGYKDANSIELDPETTHPVIALMPEQNGVEDLGGTLRLGAYPCVLKEGSKARELYGTEEISERHRHRYEVNNDYRQELEENGMVLSGLSPDKRIVEMLEIPGHPFFVGTQGHPELKSRPNRAHPLFRGLIQAAVAYHQ